jgi:sugar phosphate isomerase/epimerase
MKIGIDSYCYHRYFGEVYEGVEEQPDYTMTLEDFIKRAIELKVDGVSLETCFIPSFDESYLKKIKGMLEEGSLETVVAWGHPNGLEGGKNEEAVEDMEKHFRTCEILKADTLRIVGSSLAFRHEPHLPQIKKITKLLRESVRKAEDKGIKLAIENHFDFETDEMLMIVNNFDSDYFGITFDTGNCLRYGEEPVEMARKLSKHIFATHIKDVRPLYGGNPKDWYYYACTPVGRGIINIPGIIKALDDSGYDALYAVEIDYMHPDFEDDTDKAVTDSIHYLNTLK